MLPSSTTVTPGEATRWPMRPVKAEVPLRLKSPSRPWPTASCRRMPGQPGASTTGIGPAGASTAERRVTAIRAASRAALAPHAVLARDDVHADREQRLHVLGEDPGGVRDADPARLLAEARD